MQDAVKTAPDGEGRKPYLRKGRKSTLSPRGEAEGTKGPYQPRREERPEKESSVGGG